MALILGIDPSRNMGVALIDADTHRLEWSTCVNVDMEDGGWRHEQVHTAITRIPRRHEVTHWSREEPMARSMGQAKEHGYTCACVDIAVRATLPWAVHLPDQKPGDWRVRNGLPGNTAKKDGRIRLHAAELADWVFTTQDEADAYLIARAAHLTLDEVPV
jgi:Holliday junction resolvasome RuvABC endonuclease subunit